MAFRVILKTRDTGASLTSRFFFPFPIKFTEFIAGDSTRTQITFSQRWEQTGIFVGRYRNTWVDSDWHFPQSRGIKIEKNKKRSGKQTDQGDKQDSQSHVTDTWAEHTGFGKGKGKAFFCVEKNKTNQDNIRQDLFKRAHRSLNLTHLSVHIFAFGILLFLRCIFPYSKDAFVLQQHPDVGLVLDMPFRAWYILGRVVH